MHSYVDTSPKEIRTTRAARRCLVCPDGLGCPVGRVSPARLLWTYGQEGLYAEGCSRLIRPLVREGRKAHMLSFDGNDYQTIADVKKRFRVSEKALRNWTSKGLIEEPTIVAYGGRTFRHYTEDWCVSFRDFLNKKNAKSRDA